MKIDLKIKDRNISFWFGLGFLGELLDNQKLSVEDIFEKLQSNPFKIVPIMMYESAKYGFTREGKEIDFNLFELTDWISEEGIGSNNKITEGFLFAFNDSMTKNVPESKDESKKGVDVKKK